MLNTELRMAEIFVLRSLSFFQYRGEAINVKLTMPDVVDENALEVCEIEIAKGIYMLPAMIPVRRGKKEMVWRVGTHKIADASHDIEFVSDHAKNLFEALKDVMGVLISESFQHS